MSPIGNDLNEVIVGAVNARIEASVLEALSGDEFFGKMVTAALQKKIEVSVRGDSYRKRTVTYVEHMLETVIEKAVEGATRRLVDEQSDLIEEAVRKELRSSASAIAKQLVGSVKDATERAYGVKVELMMPSR